MTAGVLLDGRGVDIGNGDGESGIWVGGGGHLQPRT